MCISEHLTVVQTGEVFPAVIGFNAKMALILIFMSRPACLLTATVIRYCANKLG